MHDKYSDLLCVGTVDSGKPHFDEFIRENTDFFYCTRTNSLKFINYNPF